jgi:steroid 5-alpha reductase family enzyme
VILALAGLGWMIAALVMALLWAWHLRTTDGSLPNAKLIDAAWTGLVGGLAVLYAVLGDGAVQRRSAIGFMMGSWGARLTVYLLYDRVLGWGETGRYAELRRSWGEHAARRFFWLFQRYAATAVFFSFPALLASANGDPDLSSLELVAAALWIAAFTGEATADRQLERFRSQADNQGRVCQTGLWRYSRHPNYFFESLMWVAYALFAAGSPAASGGDWRWLIFAWPAAMLFLLVKGSGIPANEA